MLKSSAKHFLKTPGSRSSRRQSFDDNEEEDEEVEDAMRFSAPTPSKNFFSIFKQIQPIFSRNQEVPNAFDPDNDEATANGASSGNNQQKEGNSLFSGTSNLSLFGGLHQLDNYFGEEKRRP